MWTAFARPSQGASCAAHAARMCALQCAIVSGKQPSFASANNVAKITSTIQRLFSRSSCLHRRLSGLFPTVMCRQLDMGSEHATGCASTDKYSFDKQMMASSRERTQISMLDGELLDGDLLALASHWALRWTCTPGSLPTRARIRQAIAT